MSDDTTPKPAPAATAPTSTSIPSGSVEAPLTSWVKGGTNTTIHDNEVKRKRAEAEQRRAQEAARQKAVAQDPVGARSSNLLGRDQHPAVVLEIRNSDGHPEEFIKCELIVGTTPGELILVMCCPHCSRRHGMDESQFKFSNKHRRFELDTRRSGELWVNPLDPREFVALAGTIHLTEAVSCPTCGWRFKIDNSVLRTL